MIIIPLGFILFAHSIEEDHERYEAIKQGNSKAFSKFFDQHYDSLYRYLLNFGLQHEEVQDLVQHSFIYIWDHRAQIDSSRSLKAYLFAIGYSRMLNYLRDQKKIDHPENLDFFGTLEDPTFNENSLSTKIDRDAITDQQKHTQIMIQQAIESLAPKRQEAFRLCYLEHFSYAEAAEIMGISKKTIEHHMSLALSDLREKLKNLAPNLRGSQ